MGAQRLRPIRLGLFHAQTIPLLWGFPVNHLHVRHPVLPPTEGTLPEQEICRRLAVALGEDVSKNPLLGPTTQIMAARAWCTARRSTCCRPPTIAIR